MTDLLFPPNQIPFPKLEIGTVAKYQPDDTYCITLQKLDSQTYVATVKILMLTNFPILQLTTILSRLIMNRYQIGMTPLQSNGQPTKYSFTINVISPDPAFDVNFGGVQRNIRRIFYYESIYMYKRMFIVTSQVKDY
jgi:hypothetical protein